MFHMSKEVKVKGTAAAAVVVAGVHVSGEARALERDAFHFPPTVISKSWNPRGIPGEAF